MKKILYRIVFIFSVVLFTQCNPPSVSSRLIYNSLNSSNFSEKVFTKMLTNPDRGLNHISSNNFNKKFIVIESSVEGFKIVTISSKSSTQKHIILLHGGAYFAEAGKGHRQLIESLVLSGFKVSFIDYPLSPENNATITLRIVEKAFNKITNENPDDEFFLFGDSAGGGLALALLQILRDRDNPNIPLKTVLASPWLDISMTNKDISDYISKDVLLSYEGLKKCGKIYAHNIDLKDPKVSPIYGKFDNLSEIKIFVSNYELFYPDCMLLKNKLDSAPGSTAFLSIKEKMIHDWLVLPIKERKETISEIVSFYNVN